MENVILDILKEINPYVEINANTELLEEGILDSVSLLLLISELEEAFDLKMDMACIKADDFRTVSAIERLISKKRGIN